MSGARRWAGAGARERHHALAAVVAAGLWAPAPAFAAPQGDTPPALTCADRLEAQTPITLGGRTLQRSALGQQATLGSRVAPAAAPNEQRTPVERVFCLIPTRDAFPRASAQDAQVLAVSALTELTLLRVEVYRGAALALASDGAAPQHTLLLTAEPFWPAADAETPDAGPPEPLFIVVSREDAGRGDVRFVASVRDEPLTRDRSTTDGGVDWFVGALSEGSAFLTAVDAATYEGLLAFARCDWVSYDARRKPNASDPSPPRARLPDSGCLQTQMQALRNRIYPFVSNLTGRAHRRELQEGQPRAARSEPMVVFFGLGGANKVLLLDCRDTSGSGPRRTCQQYAEPWQTTLQRARYVWGVYVEDERTPFNTSIDVEFKAKAPSVDYEEFDPHALARAQVVSDSTGPNRLIRVGYRRFRVREPPVAVQVAFSRQGPNYGLRQWVRVYRQFSARWWVVSGAVLVPAANNAIRHIELMPVPSPDGLSARAQIVEDKPPAPIFASLVWRWPQVRGLAENMPTAWRRLAVNLIPDIAGGLSLPVRRHNSYFVGGSWPILADRLSFMMGAKIFRSEGPADGLVVGQIVPMAADVSAVRGRPTRHVDFTFGLAVELVRSR
jgi:hypothetical protein